MIGVTVHEGQLELRVPGRLPVQGSMKAVVSRSTGRAMVKPSSGERMAQVRLDVAEAMRRVDWELVEGPVAVRLSLTVRRPAGHWRTGSNANLLRQAAPVEPIGKPDVDKVARAVLDAMTYAEVWRDDSQVVDLRVVKHYTDHPGDPEGFVVIVEPR